ncbi:DUF4364 family protein [Clostridiaceae bacterium OttesenSCG-928-D20]|nr:DUF4364 family protein [Clostridiaceae bacterium OttesenSCG-928-D20]
MGLIRDNIDLKVFLVFILSRLPGAATSDDILAIAFSDSEVNYFTAMQGLNELVETGHASYKDKLYRVTEKGVDAAKTLETTLPFSVRRNALVAMEPIALNIRRDAMLDTKKELLPNGECIVKLIMSDEKGEIINMNLLTPSEKVAGQFEKRFRLEAEDIYNEIIGIFLEREREEE